jgi:hypothetical protein
MESINYQEMRSLTNTKKSQFLFSEPQEKKKKNDTSPCRTTIRGQKEKEKEKEKEKQQQQLALCIKHLI